MGRKGNRERGQGPQERPAPARSNGKRRWGWAIAAAAVLLVSAVCWWLPVLLDPLRGVVLQRRRVPVGGSVKISADGRPVVLQGVSDRPTVFYADDFLSPEEVKELVAAMEPRLRRAELVDISGRFSTESVWRQSSTSFLKAAASPDSAVSRISKRVAAVLELPNWLVEQGAQLQVQRYEATEKYYPHYDSLHLADMGYGAATRYGGRDYGKAWPHSGRYATAVLYLSDAEGGETVFPFAGLPAVPPELATAVLPIDGQRSVAPLWQRYCANVSASRPQQPAVGAAVSPRKGRAVFFYNHADDDSGLLGEMDLHSVHGSCDALTRRADQGWTCRLATERYGQLLG